MPKSRTCRNCHSDKEDVEKNIKPFVVGKKIRWTNVTELAEDVTFSHQLHVTQKQVECTSCHQGIEKSEGITSALRVSKDECLDCHVHEYISADCLGCHQSIDKEYKPPSHEVSWERSHGQVVRAGLEPPFENRCSLCHTESACSSCHQDEEPRSHTNQWRLRGHGMAARMDRTSCETCHRTDYCDRCHRETSPRNHRGGWGGTGNQHCYTCHFPLQNEGCFTCHKVNYSHLAADKMPLGITHATASESGCRTCHNALGNLKHPDNGDTCRNCHQ